MADTASPPPTPMVCVAEVATAHGVRGAVKLRCFTEDPESAASYGLLCDADGEPLFRATFLHRVKGGIVARLSGIDDRDAAEALRGTLLYVPRHKLPRPDEDEFYHDDLVGLAAVDRDGKAAGRVVAVHNFGAGDLIELRSPEGESVMVPFTRDAVPEVDLAARRVVVDPPRLV